MGRKRKYNTVAEQKAANREKAKRFYNKHRERVRMERMKRYNEGKNNLK